MRPAHQASESQPAAASAHIPNSRYLASSTERVSFELVTTRAGLDLLEQDWNDLFNRAAKGQHAFQTFNWAWHWANNFLPASDSRRSDTTLCIVTARRHGELILVWPLVRQRRAGLVHVGFLGEPVSQYGDMIVDDIDDAAPVLDQAFEFLTSHVRADVLSFRRVRADSNIAPLLARKRGTMTEKHVAPYLDLASATDFEAYEKRYSSKARKNRRRYLRRLEERAPSTIESREHGPRAGELAALAISLKRAWLKDRGLYSAALNNPATRQFFIDVATCDTHPVGAVVTSLETGGESAAIEIGFDCKGRRLVHVIVYALKFERASAGQLLIEQSVRNSFASGITAYDLLAPGDDYKLDWADASIDVCDWAFGISATGRVYTRAYLCYGRRKLKLAVNAATRLMRNMRQGHNTQTAES